MGTLRLGSSVVVPSVTVNNGSVKPVIDPLSITPTTSQQTITAPSGTDGYSPITVDAVTNSIDANIVAGNIKKDVSILGVTGTYEGSGSGSPYSIQKSVDANNKLINGGSTIIDLTGVTDIGSHVLNYAYYNNTTISGNINMSSLINISGLEACANAFETSSLYDYITSVDLSSLKSISGNSACYNMFANRRITSVDLSSLESISSFSSCYRMFGNNALSSLSLPSLKIVNNPYGCDEMFASQYSTYTSVNFPSLLTINESFVLRRMFKDCTNLTSLSFSALTSNSFGSKTSQFYHMLEGCSNVTVHFPSNLQSVIGSWSDVTSGFGGTNTTILFDLPATE